MLTNNLHSNIMHNIVGGYSPKVGDGLTMLSWTDRSVGTLHVVHNENHVEFTRDNTKRDPTKEGGIGHQDWVHETTPSTDHNGHAMKGKDGRWYVATEKKPGKWTVSKKSTPVSMGRRDYYYDWSF